MPAKSKAQVRWSYAAEARGDISPEVASEFHKGPPGKKLPQRVGKSPPSRRKVSEFGAAMARVRLTK
jgi:hypothetical protein